MGVRQNGNYRGRVSLSLATGAVGAHHRQPAILRAMAARRYPHRTTHQQAGRHRQGGPQNHQGQHQKRAFFACRHGIQITNFIVIMNDGQSYGCDLNHGSSYLLANSARNICILPASRVYAVRLAQNPSDPGNLS